MIIDASLLLSDAQAILATARSTNYIDLGQPGVIYGDVAALPRDVGKGFKIPLLVQVVTTFNTLTSLKFSAQTDGDPLFGSPTTVWESQAILLAKLLAGATWNIDVLLPNTNERYFSLQYVVAGTNPTLGKITAGVVGGVQSNGVTFIG
jgi:hypothetical protein